MTMTCSDDYLDGLQAGYKAVAKLKNSLGDNPSPTKTALNAALIAIDTEINKAIKEAPTKIILPP